MADATLGETRSAKCCSISARFLESGHLHAAIVVEMDV